MTAQKRSGNAPFVFAHRDDLRTVPAAAKNHEVDLHGTFATEKTDGDFGPLYYGVPGYGILRIDPDLSQQALIPLPDTLRPMNFHSTKIGQIGGEKRLFLPANNDALVAIITLDGALDFVLSRPEFEQYQAEDVKFAPTDTALVDDQLYVADGYGANYISTASVSRQQWTGIFGGKTKDPAENGKFATAHGISHHHTHQHLVIADRPSSRLQEHTYSGGFLKSNTLPPGSWPCGINTIQWQGRWLAVIGSLVDPTKDRPAPIYIVDADTYEVLSTIRPKEELGLDKVQHLHNVVWHVYGGQLFLVCQAWNPGFYFVLAQV